MVPPRNLEGTSVLAPKHISILAPKCTSVLFPKHTSVLALKHTSVLFPKCTGVLALKHTSVPFSKHTSVLAPERTDVPSCMTKCVLQSVPISWERLLFLWQIISRCRCYFACKQELTRWRARLCAGQPQ